MHPRAQHRHSHRKTHKPKCSTTLRITQGMVPPALRCSPPLRLPSHAWQLKNRHHWRHRRCISTTRNVSTKFLTTKNLLPILLQTQMLVSYQMLSPSNANWKVVIHHRQLQEEHSTQKVPKRKIKVLMQQEVVTFALFKSKTLQEQMIHCAHCAWCDNVCYGRFTPRTEARLHGKKCKFHSSYWCTSRSQENSLKIIF